MVKGELISSIDLTLARKISEQKAKKLKSIPFKESNEEIYIYSNIYEKSLVEEFEFIFRKKVRLVIINEDDIDSLIKIIYLGKQNEADYEVFKEAINLKASDIHFEPYRNYILVRFRIDGLLRNMFVFENKEYAAILSKIKIKTYFPILWLSFFCYIQISFYFYF